MHTVRFVSMMTDTDVLAIWHRAYVFRLEKALMNYAAKLEPAPSQEELDRFALPFWDEGEVHQNDTIKYTDRLRPMGSQ